MNGNRRSSVPPPPNRKVAPPAGPTRSDPPPPRPATKSRPAEDSPAPPATSVSVRPPARNAAKAPAARNAAKPAAPRQLPRSLRWLQLIAGAVVVLAASIAVAWGARRYVMSSPRFAIRAVLVEGNQRRSAHEIAGTGGIEVGKNIFALDPATAGAAITADPWVERATVTRRLPSSIHVAVVEREARALAAIGGELYLATRDGDLFKKLAENDPADLPVVTGITAEQVARDRPGVVIAVRRALDVVEDLDRAGVSARYPLQEIHIEKDGTLVFTIGKEAIALHLGQPPYRDKIAQAAQVLAEIARRKANASVIFLDNEAHPERVVVRMR